MPVDPTPETTPPSPRKRFRYPTWVVGVLGSLVAVLWLLPSDWALRGLAMTSLYIAAALAILLIAPWFLFFSGFPRRVRLIAAVSLVAALGGFLGSIRSVEFTGDMVPEFVFRWAPRRAELLEHHRQKHRSALARIAPERLSRSPGDSPEYRGSRRDGLVDGPPLRRQWPGGLGTPLWRQPVGGGYAAFTVVGQTAFTIEQRRADEAVVAYDTANGSELWEFAYPARFFESAGGEGPRATPTFHQGRLYSLGATGELVCLEAATGQPLWRVNILKLNGNAENLMWGMCGSPLVVGDLVIVNPGSQGEEATAQTSPRAAVLALDAGTGSLRWTAGDTRAAYTSPMLVTLDGVEQVLTFDASGLVAYDPADGRRLWSHPWTTLNDINASQPLVLPGNRVFLTSELGGAVVEVTRDVASAADGATAGQPPATAESPWKAREVWQSNTLKCSYANPVYHEGYLYGLDRGILGCVDASTGRRAWKQGRYGHGQLLLAGDLLVVLTEAGQLALVEATPDEHRELALMPAIEGKTWNNPVLVGGRIYLRNHREMACYDLTDR